MERQRSVERRRLLTGLAICRSNIPLEFPRANAAPPPALQDKTCDFESAFYLPQFLTASPPPAAGFSSYIPISLTSSAPISPLKSFPPPPAVGSGLYIPPMLCATSDFSAPPPPVKSFPPPPPPSGLFSAVCSPPPPPPPTFGAKSLPFSSVPCTLPTTGLFGAEPSPPPPPPAVPGAAPPRPQAIFGALPPPPPPARAVPVLDAAPTPDGFEKPPAKAIGRRLRQARRSGIRCLEASASELHSQGEPLEKRDQLHGMMELFADESLHCLTEGPAEEQEEVAIVRGGWRGWSGSVTFKIAKSAEPKRLQDQQE